MLCTTSNRSAVAEDEESDDLSGVEVPEINAGTDQIGDVDSCLDRRDDRVNVNVDEACGWFSGGWHGRHPSQDRKCLCLCAFRSARRLPALTVRIIGQVGCWKCITSSRKIDELHEIELARQHQSGWSEGRRCWSPEESLA